MNTHAYLVKALQYTDYVLWLDPIGSGDLRSDFARYASSRLNPDNPTPIPELWAAFNTEVVEPIYGISIPALEEPIIP